ncbi:hypothetical protein JZ751_001628, partial [Albula glossodonta]
MWQDKGVRNRPPQRGTESGVRPPCEIRHAVWAKGKLFRITNKYRPSGIDSKRNNKTAGGEKTE